MMTPVPRERAIELSFSSLQFKPTIERSVMGIGSGAFVFSGSSATCSSGLPSTSSGIIGLGTDLG